MKTILVVDDEHLIRAVGEVYFQSLGYEVILAVNGQDALNKYDEAEAIDAVILDVMMPVMNGIDCYKYLRERSATLPIIMCSGYGTDALGNDIFNDPNFRFANKPAQYSELSKTVIGMIFSAATRENDMEEAFDKGLYEGSQGRDL